MRLRTSVVMRGLAAWSEPSISGKDLDGKDLSENSGAKTGAKRVQKPKKRPLAGPGLWGCVLSVVLCNPLVSLESTQFQQGFSGNQRFSSLTIWR